MNTSRQKLEPNADDKQQQVMARLSGQAYVEDGNYDLGGTGYKVHPNGSYSNNHVTTFLNESTGELAIIHRGTAVGSKGGVRDIKADIAFARGQAGSNKKRFQDRMDFTEFIMKDSGASKIHLGGHSLGGGTGAYALANNKYIRDNITSASFYNQAANPLFKNKSNLTKEDREMLNQKVTNNRIGGDVVSAGLRSRNEFGRVKKYDAKSGEGALKSHGIEQFYDNLSGRTTHVGRERIKKKDRHLYDDEPQPQPQKPQPQAHRMPSKPVAHERYKGMSDISQKKFLFR